MPVATELRNDQLVKLRHIVLERQEQVGTVLVGELKTLRRCVQCISLDQHALELSKAFKAERSWD